MPFFTQPIGSQILTVAIRAEIFKQEKAATFQDFQINQYGRPCWFARQTTPHEMKTQMDRRLILNEFYSNRIFRIRKAGNSGLFNSLRTWTNVAAGCFGEPWMSAHGWFVGIVGALDVFGIAAVGSHPRFAWAEHMRLLRSHKPAAFG